MPFADTLSPLQAHQCGVAVVLLLRSDGAVLLQHRDNKPALRKPGMWGWPGGHCEPGESAEACARREFREETDYECGELHLLATFEDDTDDGWPAYPLTVFWSRYDGVQSLRCREGQALQFVERRLADQYPVPPYLTQFWDMAIEAASKVRRESGD